MNVVKAFQSNKVQWTHMESQKRHRIIKQQGCLTTRINYSTVTDILKIKDLCLTVNLQLHKRWKMKRSKINSTLKNQISKQSNRNNRWFSSSNKISKRRKSKAWGSSKRKLHKPLIDIPTCWRATMTKESHLKFNAVVFHARTWLFIS